MNNSRKWSRLTVSFRKFNSVLIWFAITIVEFFILSTEYFYSSGYFPLAVLICANLIIQIVILRINEIRLVSFFFVFLLCYYLFHFGEIIMLGLFPNYEYDYINYITLYMHDTKTLHMTFLVCVICINTFFLGGVCSIKEEEYSKEISHNTVREDEFISYGSGKILFFALLPIRLYLDFRTLAYALAGNYSSTFSLSFHGSGILNALGTIWYIMIPIYYLEISSQNNKKKLLLFSVSYLCLMMLTGSRGYRVIAIMTLLIVVILSQNRRIRFRKVLLYTAIAFAGLFFIDVIFEMRNVGASNFFSNPFYYLQKSLQTNILLETIGTFGETIYTPYLVIDGYGVRFDPFFGGGFIKSFASIIPDAFGWFERINNEAIFAKMLQTNHTIGGSFAGDLYYNFGSLYFVFSTIIGWIYMRISSTVCDAICCHNMKYVYKYFPFVGLSLWWIRDSIGGLTRNVVWALVMISVINSIVRNRKNEISIINSQSFSEMRTEEGK